MSEWRLRVGPVVRIVVQGVCKQICKRIRCVCACFLAGFFRILNAKALAALVKVIDGGERLVDTGDDFVDVGFSGDQGRAEGQGVVEFAED